MDDLDGVARGAETLLDVLARFTHEGWSSQFAAHAGGAVECESCRQLTPPADVPVLELRRLEGASDPDDMLAVVAVECPNCGLRGCLVLNYGPTATEEDTAVLLGLGDAPAMTLASSDAPGSTEIQLEGDIDVANAGAIGDHLCELVTTHANVVVAGAAVTFVESRGLAMMARVQRVADESGCHLAWRAFPLHVLRTIHVTGLDRYLRIEA